ncbi:DUF4381 domain-containing protein [Rhizobium herbae]
MEPQQPAPDPITEAALRSLKDIAVPPPVSWMPQTWGWALAAVILLVLLVILFLIWLRRYQADACRREALRQLTFIEQRITDPIARPDAIHELALLLKQVALASGDRAETASLSGAAWVRYMENRTENGVGASLGKMLDDGEYRGANHAADMPSDGGAKLIADARRWIEYRHVSV